MISATKKPKPQPGLSLEPYDKNGMIMAPDETTSDLMDSIDDELASGGAYAAGPASAMPLSSGTVVGTTANLSRKKATPPQPVKKLVIKPFKGKLGPWLKFTGDAQVGGFLRFYIFLHQFLQVNLCFSDLFQRIPRLLSLRVLTFW